ncbi:MAG: polysaccharide deacetylase family protein [Okeania sp. SIO3I5]|uniref:polysaccharide deacetylase family protein n=1 Tax=Okeania sp. SIO3I5 TaxID=2607805 RepID=UPI0013BA48E3|nr:polysaccharide deacetylase family protein [Okeania sp. SIO3I5]NEQ36312.1 polysaccharide deacetylase family protein [Okeania sp. SIO3I5]
MLNFIFILLVSQMSGCQKTSKSIDNFDDFGVDKSSPVTVSVSANISTAKTIIPKQVVEAVPILMYHSISVNPKNDLMVPPDVFAAQMKHLHETGYQTITFKDLEDWQAGKPIPKKPILLTFDDGYIDNYTTAYPILKKYNLQATFFISFNYLGDSRHISWQNIQEMYNSGLIQFGSHTNSHPDLTVISSTQRQAEIFQSKEKIEEKIGSEVIAFSYPAGVYNDLVLRDVSEARYKFGVTTKPGNARVEQGLLSLHRVRVHGYYTVEDFVKIFP